MQYLKPSFPDTRDFWSPYGYAVSQDGTLRDGQGQIIVFLVSPDYLMWRDDSPILTKGVEN